MPELFSEKNMMAENLQKRFEKNRAKGFYEDIFCRINELKIINLKYIFFEDRYDI
jgi:hypothetical protein